MAKNQDIHKIPKTFKLLGTNWKVKYQKNLVVIGNKCRGSVDYKVNEITIKSGDQDMFFVLLHELSHILNHLTKIGSEGCGGEIFANTSALFWKQVFTQMPLIKSTEIKNGQRRTKKANKKRA